MLFASLFLNFTISGQETELVFQTGHVASISQIAFSPDGTFLASSDEKHSVCIWDTRCQAQMGGFYFSGLGKEERITLLAFSSNNELLAAATPEGKLLIRNLSVSKDRLRQNTGLAIQGLVFTGNNNLLLFSSGIHNVDLSTGEISRISDEMPIELLSTGEQDTYIFAGRQGERGIIQTGGEPLIRDTQISTGDMQKLLVSPWSVVSMVTPGENSAMVATTTRIICFSYPEQKKLFSATMPYLDEKITDVQYLPSSSSYAVSNTDGKIYVFSVETGKLSKVLKDHLSIVSSLALHPSGRIFASGSYDRSIILWDTQSLRPLKRFYSRVSSIESMAYDQDKNLLAFGNELGYVKTIRLSDAYPDLRSVKNHRQKVSSVVFNEDGSLLYTGSNDNHICKLTVPDLDLEKKKKFKSYFNPKILFTNTVERFNMYVEPHTFIDSLNFSESSDKLLAYGYRPKVIYKRMPVVEDGVPTGRKKRMYLNQRVQYLYSYNPSGMSRKALKRTKINEPEPKAADSILLGVPVFNEKNGHIADITGHAIDPEENWLITASRDATIKIWDLGTRELTLTIIPVDRDKRILITPENHYFAPKNSLDAIGFRQGTRYYPLEQFDLLFNRPDLVLERIRGKDSLLISMYRNAYEKRLRKSGFSAEQFSPEWHSPEVEILNARELGFTAANREVELKVKASDTKYLLDRFNIWVNDVPIYGTSGVSIKDEASENIEKTFLVPLSDGNNRIEVSCMNEKGVESLKIPIDLAYQPPVPSVPDLYLIAMSVSDYKDSRYNLAYAAKDGRDLVNMFSRETDRGIYGRILSDTLFNRLATRENFFSLRNKLLQTKPDDKVIVFISGHGLLNSDLDFYFATWDMDFSNPEARGISFDDLEHFLDSIPARKKLMLMDACHSGEVDKESGPELLAQQVEVSSEISFRGNLKEYNFRGAGTNDAFKEQELTSSFELMQELFTGLDKGTGTMVISAAAGKGYALESDKWNNGVFTFSILNGLKNKAADRNRDKKISITELKNYSITQVEKLTGGRQKPNSRRDSVFYDWRIW